MFPVLVSVFPDQCSHVSLSMFPCSLINVSQILENSSSNFLPLFSWCPTNVPLICCHYSPVCGNELRSWKSILCTSFECRSPELMNSTSSSLGLFTRARERKPFIEYRSDRNRWRLLVIVNNSRTLTLVSNWMSNVRGERLWRNFFTYFLFGLGGPPSEIRSNAGRISTARRENVSSNAGEYPQQSEGYPQQCGVFSSPATVVAWSQPSIARSDRKNLRVFRNSWCWKCQLRIGSAKRSSMVCVGIPRYFCILNYVISSNNVTTSFKEEKNGQIINIVLRCRRMYWRCNKNVVCEPWQSYHCRLSYISQIRYPLAAPPPVTNISKSWIWVYLGGGLGAKGHPETH